MKKGMALFLAAVMVLCLMPAASAGGIESFDAAEALLNQNIWDYLAEFESLRIDRDTHFDDEYGEDCSIYELTEFFYDPDGDVLYRIQNMDSPDYYEYSFAESEPKPKIFSYYESGGDDEYRITDFDLDAYIESCYQNISGYDLTGARLRYAEEDDGYYICNYDLGDRDVTFYFDAETEWLAFTVETCVTETGSAAEVISSYAPCETDELDFTFRDSISAAVTGIVSGGPDTKAAARAEKLSFNTVDLYGNPVDESIIQGSSLVILNIWEPWCSPCCKELPDMERIYQKYRDAGVLFIGVYDRERADFDDYDNFAKSRISEAGVTYPIIKDCEALRSFQNNGWPSNYFFDGEGNLLQYDDDNGYMNYEAWEKLILSLLYR